MKKGVVVSLLASLVLVLVVVLPATAAGEETKPEAKPEAKAEVKTDAKVDGKALYSSKCAMCHGADGVAKKMAAGSANLNDAAWQEKATLESIEQVIRDGKGKMPKSDKLTAEQVTAIATYVKTLK